MLQHFAGREAVVVLFAWPTAENFLRYARDIRNALGSAPQLADLVRLLAAAHRAREDRRLHLLRRRHRRQRRPRASRPRRPPTPPPASARSTTPPPTPTSAPSSTTSPPTPPRPAASPPPSTSATARSASRGAVNRASRAGRPDLAELSPETSARLLAAAADGEIELVQVHPDVMPELSATSHTFWYDHPWASNDVLLTLLFHLPPAARGLDPATAPSGAAYWTFPEDYPARMPAVVDAVRAAAAAPR